MFQISSLIRSRTLTLLARKFASPMIRFAIFADAISIPLLSFFLNFQLRRWRSKGLLNYYRVDLRRISKSYYVLSLHLVFEWTQARRILVDLVAEILGRL